MSCGLKNSQCQDATTTALEDAEPGDPLQERFSFVDGNTGQWTIGQTYDNITCPVGGLIVFHYPVGIHDIIQVEQEDDWNACQNLNGSTLLSPREILIPDDTAAATARETTRHNIIFPEMSYYHHCSTPGSVAYLTCSAPGHCEANQKVRIQTSDTNYAYNVTTGNWTLHVDSLSRVLTLLGYRTIHSNGNTTEEKDKVEAIIMDRGYQTEALANVTTELIWCALDHCPGFAPDFNPTATVEYCQSTIYTLLGFISRKRPIPQWNVSEDYYRRAIDTADGGGGGNQNNNAVVCTARSYLSQLFLTKRDWVNASIAVEELCGECGQDQPALIQQARAEYLRLEISTTELDFDQVCTSAISHWNNSLPAGSACTCCMVAHIMVLLFLCTVIPTRIF